MNKSGRLFIYLFHYLLFMFSFFVGFGKKEVVPSDRFRLFLKAVERGHIGRFNEPVFRLLAKECLGRESGVHFLNELVYSSMSFKNGAFLAVLSEGACQCIFDDYYVVLMDYYWNEMGRVESFVVYDFECIKVGLVSKCFQHAAYELLRDQECYMGFWKRFCHWVLGAYKSLP